LRKPKIEFFKWNFRGEFPKVWICDFSYFLGLLSEVLGDKALEVDQFVRTFGFYRIACEDVKQIDENSKKKLVAYITGINDFLASNYYVHPVEFTLGKFPKPKPWTLEDVACFYRYFNTLFIEIKNDGLDDGLWLGNSTLSALNR
jgi:hypothetical protein